MTQQLGLYPSPQPLPASSRARIRSIIMAAATRPAVTPHPIMRWRVAGLLIALALATGLLVAQPWSETTVAWAAVPEQLDPAATARLGSECAAAIAAAHFPMSISSAVPVLAEGRGSSHAVVLGSTSQVDLCISPGSQAVGCSDGGVCGVPGDFFGVYDVEPLAPGAVGVVDAVQGVRKGGAPLRVIVGRLASDGQVTVTTADGLRVIASVAKGYFLAWWPSHADAVSVVVTLPGGETHMLSVPDQAPPTPMRTSGS